MRGWNQWSYAPYRPLLREVGGIRTLLVLIVLAISTSLNTVYFLRTVITLYRKPLEGASYPVEKGQRGFCFNAALVLLALINIALGVFSQAAVNMITAGLGMFS